VRHSRQIATAAILATFIGFMAGLFSLGHMPGACPTVHAGAAP
jgi:hypothetical protein